MLLELLLHLLKLTQLFLLLRCIVAERLQPFAHLLLRKHEVLHPRLHHSHSSLPFIRDPPTISIFLQIGVRNGVQILKYASSGVVFFKNTLPVEVQVPNLAPIDSTFLLPLTLKILVRHDVVVSIDHFYFALLQIGVVLRRRHSII